MYDIGKIIEITKSEVMTTFHGLRKNGIPMDVTNTVALFTSVAQKAHTR